MMTNKEHDDLYKKSCENVPEIASALRRANVFAILKELYDIGEYDKKDYVNAMIYLAELEGFKIS